jgi:hypothetical protein
LPAPTSLPSHRKSGKMQIRYITQDINRQLLKGLCHEMNNLFEDIYIQTKSTDLIFKTFKKIIHLMAQSP